MKHKILHRANILLDWNELFEYTQMYCLDKNLHKYTQIAGNNHITDNKTYRLRILGKTPKIYEIQERLDKFYEIFDLENFKQQKQEKNLHSFCAIYFSFFPYAESHGNHCDDTDLFHWQQVGQTQWKITEDGKKYVYTLNPGDCIFIPEGVHHDVHPLTSRIGLSFGFAPKHKDQ
jgi:hypothetical protein